ncbi:MAG: XRE family transcriptional regulator [Lachnospiraceae bacterium]|nr:XRE family transcriptional regulator [Lachnospiraceae bacterium]
MKKDTSTLTEELDSCLDLSVFLRDNQDEMIAREVGSEIERIRKAKKISKVDLARKAEISEFYLYQVIGETRKPSRDKLLCLCLALSCSAEETDRLLRLAGHGNLYIRVKRDAIVQFALQHQWPLEELNQKLEEEGEAPL